MTFSSSEPELQAKVTEWMKWDENEGTRSEIQTLIDNNDVEELRRRLLTRISFGTAGLRGRMCAGYNNMNDLVIIQTCQGLSEYLLQSYNGEITSGIVVGYDGRHNSERWAKVLATVMINKNIPVRLFSQMVPTPIVAFATRYYKCMCGVVITASHNPKQDNGYKVYWNNGAQIISPHDKNITNHILNNLKPLASSWLMEDIRTNVNVTDPLEEITQEYFSRLSRYSAFRGENELSNISAVYTAMHGVGTPFVRRAVKTFGFKPLLEVEEQCTPDPEFSTVKFPNPEEGKSSLDLAMRKADSTGLNLILANDPDADRLAAAEKLDSGWKVFTGNELGCLLGWWSLFCYKKSNPHSDKKVYMLASTVSSKILQSISSQHDNFHFVETLTGFKWMGNKAIELQAEGHEVIFAFEEAIGFMCGTLNFDKDGISALVVLLELAVYLRTHEQKTLNDKLLELHTQYGKHVSYNTYYICHDPEKIARIFTRIRHWNANRENTYIEALGDMKILSARDLTTGYDNSQHDNKPILPVSSSSEMITFTIESSQIGQIVTTLRTSGTEPKIKIYSEVISKPQSDMNGEELKCKLVEKINSLVDELLEPVKNELIPQNS